MTPTHLTARAALACMAIALLAGCTEVAPLAVDGTAPLENRAASRCANVEADIDVPLGLWVLDGEVVLGGAPFPMTLAGIEGWMASAVREQSNPGGSPTARLTLNHVFVTEEPGESMGLPAIFLDEVDDYFLTDDRAVCAAGSDPTACRINNRMEVVDGAGIFANADGFLHNHGTITFVPEPGQLVSQLRGRICGDGLGG